MKALLILFLYFLRNVLSEVPNWDFTKSADDLLNNEEGSANYKIDDRSYWYEASDTLTKYITKNENELTFRNKYELFDKERTSTKFSGNVEFESIESFYSYVDGETDKPIICPRGSYNPYEVIDTNTIEEISKYSTDWIKNSNFDLKCYYHREEPFLVFYLMNGENYVLRLSKSVLKKEDKFKFGDDVEEIYDFKLQNRENRKGKGDSWVENPYPFMALVKKDNYLQLISTSYDIYATTRQKIAYNKTLLPIKQYTQAYFNNFHYNNSFFYFTYNNISDFTSGYSSTTVSDEDRSNYTLINDVVVVNNLRSPFEFTEEVEIIYMNIMYNNNLVYYKILNKVANKTYHGILDIITNKIVWSTEKEVLLFYAIYIY